MTADEFATCLALCGSIKYVAVVDKDGAPMPLASAVEGMVANFLGELDEAEVDEVRLLPRIGGLAQLDAADRAAVACEWREALLRAQLLLRVPPAFQAALAEHVRRLGAADGAPRLPDAMTLEELPLAAIYDAARGGAVLVRV